MKRIILLLVMVGIVVLPAIAKDIKPKMVPIPGTNYAILNVEVTQSLYQEVMGNNPSYFIGIKKFNSIWDDDNNVYYQDYKIVPTRPVENVSWIEAIRFCNRLSKMNGFKKVYIISEAGKVTLDKSADGFRLPTVEEWVYAAKGGEDYKYSGSDDLDDVAWYSNNNNGMTHPVGQLDPNGYGLYDMSGNVWEWCWDAYPGHEDYFRFVCGGSYSSKAGECTVYSRDSANHNGGCNLGFRVVRNIK